LAITTKEQESLGPVDRPTSKGNQTIMVENRRKKVENPKKKKPPAIWRIGLPADIVQHERLIATKKSG